MIGTPRLRWLGRAALTAVLAVAIAGCAQVYPNSTFTPHTDFGRSIDALWDTLLFWGTIVFVFVEAVLLWVVFRFRHRPGAPEPEPLHGHTALEIAWTLIPALILVVIAIPTVRTIFVTEGAPPAGYLDVQVIGHQWWWEFRYPQYTTTRADGSVDTLVTANEMYLPNGRTAYFTMTSKDVIHAFWTPQLGGKRDVVPNRTNHIWYTPDADLGAQAWNGFCGEYCGTSHANMRFRAFTVPAANFEEWAQHQLTSVVYTGPPPAPDTTAAGRRAAAARAAAPPPPPPVTPVAYEFPRAQLPQNTIPQTPIPAGLTFPAGLTGDAERGRLLLMKPGPAPGGTMCFSCHTIRGNPLAVSNTGPRLTHIASRTTIAGGLYPNDAEHLALWIKDAPMMKPGSKMPTQGKGLVDPDPKMAMYATLTDEQIADIVAYLLVLK